jgi:hypothetical protein
MFPREDTILREVNLETVTPEEALALVQQLPADILRSAHFTYYEGLLRALALVAEAALRNQGKPNGPRGVSV